MDADTAQIVAVAITLVGVLAWLAGVSVVLAASRSRERSARLASERFEVSEGFPPGTIVGEAQVAGDAEELSTKLAGQLARDGVGPFGPVKIVAKGRDEVVFEPSGRPMGGFRGGRVKFEPARSGTRVDYAVEVSSRGIMIGAWIALALGLAAVIGGPWLVFAYLLPSPNPNVRAQAFQLCQISHFLWPPFLLAYLARQPGRIVKARMDALIHNLPFS